MDIIITALKILALVLFISSPLIAIAIIVYKHQKDLQNNSSDKPGTPSD